jgi:hypothetical protein
LKPIRGAGEFEEAEFLGFGAAEFGAGRSITGVVFSEASRASIMLRVSILSSQP